MTDWQDAYNDTTAHLSRMQGLTTVLNEIAWDFEGLNNPDPMSYGILTLIRTIHEDLCRLDALHELEWEAKQAEAQEVDQAA
ncbi:hypothetical protein [Paracoccus spongiarum]|uniref:Uncharacterized protein n=1 Tax=Paracoccus spongiarum TaxID=3064387 RepID=A0ABT9JCQ0_9RHOB|nr:hypothetical protein [Paracoccus sp. 2205BS29-5]MDP5307585.1 hypothetical protein [Paracoccus sp. 2205BS29-5]